MGIRHHLVIDTITNNEVKNFEYSVTKRFYQEHLKDWSIARITADPNTDCKKLDIEVRAEKKRYRRSSIAHYQSYLYPIGINIPSIYSYYT